jgi:2-dehydropantoate 2-reductase
MRVLVVGVGVIGSVYAGKLAHVGHEVVLFARGRRLTELQNDGLVLQEARSDELTVLRLPILSEISNERYDLILVPVRSEQLVSTLPILTAITAGDSDVLFFGNTAGRQAELAAVLGDRVLFGFPAVGGVRDGSVIKYVLINQQKTMLGESNGETTPRIQRLQSVFDDAGFSTKISANIDGWLLAHAAFIVPIALSLYRVGISAAKLSADSAAMRLMVLATRQGFAALRFGGNTEVPANLHVLYNLPTAFVVAYWRRVFASPRGEFWFAAHARSAPEEMHSLAKQLQASLPARRRSSPDLDGLLATSI